MIEVVNPDEKCGKKTEVIQLPNVTDVFADHGCVDDWWHIVSTFSGQEGTPTDV